MKCDLDGKEWDMVCISEVGGIKVCDKCTSIIDQHLTGTFAETLNYIESNTEDCKKIVADVNFGQPNFGHGRE